MRVICLYFIRGSKYQSATDSTAVPAPPSNTMMKSALVRAACLAALCCGASAATTGETVMGYTFGSEIKGERSASRPGVTSTELAAAAMHARRPTLRYPLPTRRNYPASHPYCRLSGHLPGRVQHHHGH